MAADKGTLDVYRATGGGFSGEEVELAKGFADALALALDNAEIRVRLERRAQSDSLTGLYNQRSFQQRLRAAVAEAEPTRRPVAVLMVDLDDFKRVNDVHGHVAGDEALQRFSRVSPTGSAGRTSSAGPVARSLPSFSRAPTARPRG